MKWSAIVWRSLMLSAVLQLSLGRDALAQNCLNVELRREMKAGEAVLKEAKDVSALPKLREAYDKLNELRGRAEAASDFCLQTLPSDRIRVINSLRARIAELGAKEEQVTIAFSAAFEGAAVDQDVRAVQLDGGVVNLSGKVTVMGGDHTLVIEFEPPRTRDLSFEIRVDNTPLPDVQADRTEGSRTYILPTLQPGQHSISIVLTGKERPKQRYLKVDFFEGTAPEGLSLVLDDQEYTEFDKKILLPVDKPKLEVRIVHPERETSDGWFRLGAKVGSKSLKPVDKEGTNTTYLLQVTEPNTTLRLQPVTGPKESKLRTPLLIGGGIVAVLGGGWALLNLIEGNDAAESGLKAFNDKGCDDVEAETCDLKAQRTINDFYDDSDAASVQAIVGVSVAGVGLLTAGVAYFLLESGQDPPRDLARPMILPTFTANSVGASVLATW